MLLFSADSWLPLTTQFLLFPPWEQNSNCIYISEGQKLLEKLDLSSAPRVYLSANSHNNLNQFQIQHDYGWPWHISYNSLSLLATPCLNNTSPPKPPAQNIHSFFTSITVGTYLLEIIPKDIIAVGQSNYLPQTYLPPKKRMPARERQNYLPFSQISVPTRFNIHSIRNGTYMFLTLHSNNQG